MRSRTHQKQFKLPSANTHIGAGPQGIEACWQILHMHTHTRAHAEWAIPNVTFSIQVMTDTQTTRRTQTLVTAFYT